MLTAFGRAFKTPDLRRKILFTLSIITLYRLGAHVPTPGVSYKAVQECMVGADSTQGFLGLANLFSGGALLQLSIFALGIMPYITASIIIQLLTVVIPRFETLKKEGQAGQTKMTQYTRYLTIGLAVLQSSTLITFARNPSAIFGPQCTQILADDSMLTIVIMVLTLTAGTGLIMWLAELITDRGIGNGMSLLIFTSIAAGFPSSLWAIQQAEGRWDIFIGIILVGFLVALLFINRIVAFVMVPLQRVLPDGGKLVYTEPAEAFLLQLKIAFLVGLFLALPVILFELWMFIAPGLYSHEKKFAIPFVVFATIFFVAGAAFSHYMVFPWAWGFFAGFATDYMSFMPKIDATFSLYVRMLLAMGAVFQLPTLVFFLARLGMITPRFMIKNTKYAILIIFIIAAVLTPSPDIITQVLMAAPMIVLYGLSILIAWIFQKRKPAPEA